MQRDTLGPMPSTAVTAAFRWPVRVYYEDTDAGGIVYYANYLKFFERCRTEWLRALGVNQIRLAAQDGLQFVVTSLACDYKRPARLDDQLTVLAALAQAGRASLTFEQQILRESADAAREPELLATGRVKVACVDTRRLAPAPMPAALIDALRRPLAAA